MLMRMMVMDAITHTHSSHCANKHVVITTALLPLSMYNEHQDAEIKYTLESRSESKYD